MFDTSSGQERRYNQGWQWPEPVGQPDGGTVIDVEARSAIAALVSALVSAGVVRET